MKKKLVSGILTGVFALAALIVGVYALIKVGMTFSGGIGFNPNGVYVELSGQVYRGKDFNSLEDIHDKPSYTYQKQTNYSETETKKIEGWQAENVLFTPLYRHIQYRITVKNLSSEDISVIPSEITWQNGNSDNLNVIEEASATLRIPAGEERDYKLNFVLTDAAQDFTNKNWGITLNILKTSDIQTPADSYFSMSGTELQSLTSSGYSTSQFGNRVLRVPDTVGGAQVLSTKSASSADDATFKNLNSETKYVILPSGLTALGAYAFYARGVQAIGFSETLLSIGEGAFRYNNLKNLFLPKNVNTLGHNILGSNPTIVELEVDKMNPTFYSGNTNAIIKSDSNELVFGCQFSKVEEGVVSIGDTAFAGCSSLKDIKFPSTLKTIQSAAFWGCYGLKEVVIPNNVQAIGDYAFYELINCETLNIGTGVTSIGLSAFDNCNSLKYIKMSGNALSSAYTLSTTSGKVWVTSASPEKPTNWINNVVTTIPTSAGDLYYHQQAAWEK